MYGVLPAVCCCGEPGPPPPGDEYYVFTPCDYFEDYCCPPANGCEDAPSQIIWCNWYAVQQGLQQPFDPEICVLIKWNDCCIYQLSGIIDDPCPSPPQPAQNIGSVFTQYVSSEERPCCSPVPAEPEDESGCLYKQLFDDDTPWTPGPCDDLIAFEYDNYDQFGTVTGKEVKVSAQFKFCYESFGVPHFTRCDDADPIVVKSAEPPKHVQLIGLCIPTDDDTTTNCDNQRTEVFLEYVDCATANPDRPCCGDDDPCAGLTPEEYDEYLPDPAKSYSIRTCYRVNNCEDDEGNQLWFEEDVMFLDFPWCHSGINPDAENVQDLLDAFYIDEPTGVVKTDNASSITTLWGATSVATLEVCDYIQTIVSGNADQLSSAINNRIGDMVTATSIAPWDTKFWFGRRQTCDPCEAFDEDLIIPPWSEADELVVDRVIPRTAGPRVYLKGRSRKKYICTAKTLISPANVACNCTASSCDITTAAVSATGNDDDGFQLDCVSPAEYANGRRYSMRRVGQTGCTTDICIDSTTWLTVEKCADLSGGLNYPPIDFCPAFVTTQIKCRQYPHIYEVACCNALICAEPVPCIQDMFQNPKEFCETDGSVIEVL